jgi:hypothetical protein
MIKVEACGGIGWVLPITVEHRTTFSKIKINTML